MWIDWYETMERKVAIGNLGKCHNIWENLSRGNERARFIKNGTDRYTLEASCIIWDPKAFSRFSMRFIRFGAWDECEFHVQLEFLVDSYRDNVVMSSCLCIGECVRAREWVNFKFYSAVKFIYLMIVLAKCFVFHVLIAFNGKGFQEMRFRAKKKPSKMSLDVMSVALWTLQFNLLDDQQKRSWDVIFWES